MGIAPWDHAERFGRVEPVAKFGLQPNKHGMSARGKMLAEAGAGLGQLF